MANSSDELHSPGKNNLKSKDGTFQSGQAMPPTKELENTDSKEDNKSTDQYACNTLPEGLKENDPGDCNALDINNENNVEIISIKPSETKNRTGEPENINQVNNTLVSADPYQALPNASTNEGFSGQGSIDNDINPSRLQHDEPHVDEETKNGPPCSKLIHGTSDSEATGCVNMDEEEVIKLLMSREVQETTEYLQKQVLW